MVLLLAQLVQQDVFNVIILTTVLLANRAHILQLMALVVVALCHALLALYPLVFHALSDII